MLHRSKSLGYLARKLLWPVVVFVWFYYLLVYPLYHFHIWEGGTSTQECEFGAFLIATCSDIVGYFVDNKGLGPSWFIIALFYIKALCYFAEHGASYCKRALPQCFSTRFLEAVILLLLWCICLYLPEIYGKSCGYHGWRNVGYVGNAVMAMPYYLLGRWFIQRLSIVETFFASRPFASLLGAFVMAGIVSLAVHYNGGISMFCILFGHQPFPYNMIWCYASGICGTCMILFLSMMLPRTLNDTWLRAVNLSATSLMGVVGFQYFFCEVVRHTIGLEQPYLLSIVLSLLIYAICVLLWRIFQKLHIL